jgi:probable HAF family extracellular repeat protein
MEENKVVNSRARILPTLLAVAILGVSTTAAQWFTGVGDLPGRQFSSTAYGLSADGRVAVGFSQSANSVSEAFYWTANTGIVGMGVPPVDPNYAYSYAIGASRDGTVIAGGAAFPDASGHHGQAFRWTAATGMVPLGGLPGNSLASEADGMSADGRVIVGISASYAGDQAFRWTQATGMVGLGDLPGGTFKSFARGASADGGVVVGNGYTERGSEAFRWTAETGMVPLGDGPNGTYATEANAVSADGTVIIGKSTAGAFRWTASRFEIIGIPNFITIVNAMTADGSIVAGWTNRWGLTARAALWDEQHGWRAVENILVQDYHLDLTGWSLQEATGISADGLTIFGNGKDPLGRYQGWIAHVPEPSTIILLALALCYRSPRR